MQPCKVNYKQKTNSTYSTYLADKAWLVTRDHIVMVRLTNNILTDTRSHTHT